MKLFAVIGNPISHSRSPLIHNSAFKLLRLHNYCYTRVLLQDEKELKHTIIRLGLSGANVTVPFKEEAFRICDEVDDFAARTGAVNTIIVKDGKLYGKNTDGPGFFISLSNFRKVKSAVILGAGGTARAVSEVLRLNGIEVTILNRSKERLEFFRNSGFDCSTFDDYTPRDVDVVINTTSAGLTDTLLPCDEKLFGRILSHSAVGIDVIYGKQTGFLKKYEDAGKPCIDGSGMLMWQAYLAFIEFYGKEFDNLDVISEMERSFSL